MTQEVKILVGIPASGKSTWAEYESQRLEEEFHTTCIISRDFVRKSMLRPGDDYFSHEKEVFKEFVRQINEAIRLGIDYVFVDATHINTASRRKILAQLIVDPHTDLSFEVFPIDLNTALERNSHREGFARVPDEGIISMNKGFTVPTIFELPDNSYGFRTVHINIRRRKEDVK